MSGGLVMAARWLSTVFDRALITRVPRDHTEPDRAFRRRRLVVAVTFLVGAGLLGVSLRVEPGDARFYWLTALLAMVWAVGGLLSGPLHLGRIQVGRRFQRPVLAPVVIGAALAVVFVAGALVVRAVPWLRGYLDDVLAYATYGNLPAIVLIAVVNGVAEELFFRGGLFAALGRRFPVLVSTVAYALATAATGNPMLIFAATVVGVVLGLQRRASGGILAPVITHVTWSLLMLALLPALLLG